METNRPINMHSDYYLSLITQQLYYRGLMAIMSGNEDSMKMRSHLSVLSLGSTNHTVYSVNTMVLER